MQIEQLWNEIDARIHPHIGKRISISEANHRITSEPIRAMADQPAFDQSAMDGFAFADAVPGRCRISARIAAGSTETIAASSGEAIRIFTGGVIPKGTFAVAKQEDCIMDGDFVSLHPNVHLNAGGHIRRQGEIFRKDDVLVPAGTRLGAGALALLASGGVSCVNCHTRISVLHLVTGDEIIPTGTPLQSGQTYDSNGPMLHGLLKELDVVCQTQAIRDDPDYLVQLVSDCKASLLLISGGSGPGDRDHTIHALESAGFTIHANRINSRPGKPLIFATRGNQAAFGLPGNPLAHWVCFHAFVRRVIARFHGDHPEKLLTASLTQPVTDIGDGRRTWTPAYLEASSGQLQATPLPWKHSGDLTPLVTANALIFDTPMNAISSVTILPVS